MRRRDFIGLLGGAAAWPLGASAQVPRRPHVVIWLGGVADAVGKRHVAAFSDALRGLGWIDERNLRIEVRWIGTSFGPEEARAAAIELAALKPDVIVTTGAPLLQALRGQNTNIPIVFTLVTDPVGDGFVTSLARPGGNMTGFTIFEHSFAGKWLEMLKEMVPSMARVLVMQNTGHPAWPAYLEAIGTIALAINVAVTPAPVSNPDEIAAALAAFARAPNGGLILLPSPLVTHHRDFIASAAQRHRLPSIYLARLFAESGGLMSYGPDTSEFYRQAARYVARILKGEKPGELPVQAASRFEMAINLKTAKALGIAVPATMLGRADEVIE